MIRLASAGWATFTYKDFIGHISYLTDAPVDLLDGIVQTIKTYEPQIVRFDEEGSEFYLIFARTKSVIVVEREKTQIHVIDMPIFDIAKQILTDIKTEGTWKWADEFAISINDIEEMEYEIRTSMEELEELIGEKND